MTKTQNSYNLFHKAYRIIFVGSQWHGANPTGLTRSLRKQGHIVKDVDIDHYMPHGQSLIIRMTRKLMRRSYVKEYNTEIIRQAYFIKPQIAIIYKGTFVKPETLQELKQAGTYLVNVYPDVSMFTHGKLIPKCLPLYDQIFTTKSFGKKDIANHFGIHTVKFLPHGFDPAVHRPLELSEEEKDLLGCDVSFIGTWSPKKEKYLGALAKSIPSLNFRIFGSQWDKATNPSIQQAIQGTHILGDLYAMAIQCSKINIALLSEKRKGASDGDQITSRTFHIPASGGFMVHERTAELLQYYSEGEEIACFGSPQELVEVVLYYINHEREREKIRISGHRRCFNEYSLDTRAEKIIKVLQKQGNY